MLAALAAVVATSPVVAVAAPTGASIRCHCSYCYRGEVVCLLGLASCKESSVLFLWYQYNWRSCFLVFDVLRSCFEFEVVCLSCSSNRRIGAQFKCSCRSIRCVDVRYISTMIVETEMEIEENKMQLSCRGTNIPLYLSLST